jgi:hypothetical protein
MAAERRVGRNDLCPCGSGRKYKRCCLAGEAEIDLHWHRMRRAEGVVVNAVLDHVRERYGWGMVDKAWAEFRCWASIDTSKPATDRRGKTGHRSRRRRDGVGAYCSPPSAASGGGARARRAPKPAWLCA